jgi:hypothetical protein
MICWESLLLGIGIGFCASFLMWHYLLSSVVQNKEQLQQLIGKLISEVYHKNIYPEICRIQGIFNTLLLELELILKDCELAKRPDHYRYIELVERGLKKIRDGNIGLKVGLDETLKLKKRFSDIIKKYEPYQ